MNRTTRPNSDTVNQENSAVAEERDDYQCEYPCSESQIQNYMNITFELNEYVFRLFRIFTTGKGIH